MRIQLLIADSDRDYAEHLSRVLSERYEDVFEVSACFGRERLTELLRGRSYDAALLGPELAESVDISGIRLPFLLWDGASAGWMEERETLRKYQRISALAGEVLERYAEVSGPGLGPGALRAHITVSWSPAGGVGKTVAALAYAVRKVFEGKRTVYLDLEPFSSTPAFFQEGGKSISTVFAKLEGRADLALQGIRQEDSGSGVCYFRRPDNYEDISLLTSEDVRRLTEAAASGVDELVVDIGSAYDQRTAVLLELADTVLLVNDGSRPCQEKWEQFRAQHSLYEAIRHKSILVANKGAWADASQAAALVRLPAVRSKDPAVVYKTLSAASFGD